VGCDDGGNASSRPIILIVSDDGPIISGEVDMHVRRATCAEKYCARSESDLQKEDEKFVRFPKRLSRANELTNSSGLLPTS
jgi:hypothetical protein